MYKSKSGFTIVELMIVIVVIGILAAITIIAYNGVQNHAYAVKVASAVDEWKDVLEIYRTKSANDQYPVPASGPYVCLGENFPADSNFTTGQCYTQSGGSLPTAAFTSDPTLMASIKTTTGQLPDGLTPTVTVTSDGSTQKVRGPLYISFGLGAAIIYYLNGDDQVCPKGTKTVANGFTACSITLQ